MKKFFVVGATGYIGKMLFEQARKLGDTIGTSSTGKNNLHCLNLEYPEVFDYEIIAEGDIVLVSAAISAPDICAREYDRSRAVNVIGTSMFIKRAIEQGARVVFFSSDTVYGECKDEFTERAGCSPAGEYARMKHEVEQRFHENEAFKVIRLSYVFSREDKFTCYLATCAKNSKEAELFHPFSRAIVHRDDVVEGTLALATRWDEIPDQFINFGGPQVLSRIDFAECLKSLCFHELSYNVTEPSADFYKNRPRIIAMRSPVFASILKRTPRTLHEAACHEFGLSSSLGGM